MDVFSSFLVTLDYPMRNLILGPLPPRPDETAAAKPTLQTAGSPYEDSNNPDTASAGTAKAETKTAPRGPQDR